MSGRESRAASPGGKGKGTRFGVIRQTVIVGASPLEVYEAYVDPKRHAAFTGSGTTGSPKVGGRFTAGDGYTSGRYLELEPGKRVVHEWTTSEWPDGYPPSVLELTLRPKEGATELTMVQSKVPAEQVEYYAEGWKKYYWGPMKEYFSKAKQQGSEQT